MKAPMRIALAATALLALVLPASAQVKDYREIQTPALRSFNPVEPKRIQLPNGMVIFLQEDRELPLIRATAVVRGGSRDVPAAKAGLAEIYGQSWRTGGTATSTGDQLDEMLETRAARVETSGDDDSTAVTFDILKNDLDFVFPIFLDVLRNPAFRQDKIDLAKTQINSVISRRNDEPDDILTRELRRLGYGPDSAYVRQPEYTSIASVTREDLLAFHKRFVHPNNIIFGVTGDFDAAAMERQLRTAFSKWAAGPAAPKAPTDITAARPAVYFIAKEDVTQSNIAVLHGGTIRSNPDYPAVRVMNEILSGGTFSGRLMNSLRTRMGLTYGVSGAVGTDWDHPGLFRVVTSTKSETTLQTIDAVRKELADLRSGDVTADELRLAKDSILNAFVFTMDSRAKMLRQRMELEFYGYPPDFYQRYPALVGAVTAADIKRVANKYVQPDQYAILVVGDQKAFEKPLSTLGTVTPIDITIPPAGATPGAAAAPTATASSAEGLALAGKVRDFVGGKGAIDAVQAMRSTGSMTRKTPQGDMAAEVEAIIRYPDSQRMVLKLPIGEITTVASPGAAFMLTPMGTQDLPGSQRESATAELKTDTINVLKNIENPKYVFTAAGSEKVGDVSAQKLSINADGNAVTWYVDPSSGRLLRKSAEGGGPQAGEQVTEYREWMKSGGLNLPSSTVVMRGGEQVAAVTVTKIEINPSIDAAAFTKPAAK